MTVTLRDTGEIIGDCGILPYNWEGPEIELAYRYRPSAWGQGYAKEAGKAVLGLVWQETEINELLASRTWATPRPRKCSWASDSRIWGPQMPIRRRRASAFQNFSPECMTCSLLTI